MSETPDPFIKRAIRYREMPACQHTWVGKLSRFPEDSHTHSCRRVKGHRAQHICACAASTKKASTAK